jgi:hypothetical protein
MSNCVSDIIIMFFCIYAVFAVIGIFGSIIEWVVKCF